MKRNFLAASFLVLFNCPLALAEYTVSTIPGQTYATASEAEAEMRKQSPVGDYLEPYNVTVSSSYVETYFRAPGRVDPFLGDNIVYMHSLLGPQCFNTLDEAKRALEQKRIEQGYCSYVVSENILYQSQGYVTGAPCFIGWDYSFNEAFSIEVEAQSQDVFGNCSVNINSVEAFGKYTEMACPDGWLPDGNFHCYPSGGSYAVVKGQLTQTAPAEGQCVGNPCDVISGNKIQHENDGFSNALPFSRTYQSSGQARTRSGLGFGWYHSYARYLVISASGNSVYGYVDAKG